MATAKGKRPQAGAKKTTASRGPAKKKTGSRGGTSARRSDQQILSSAMIGVMVFGISLLLTLALFSKSNAPLILFLRSEINAWFGNMRFAWMLIVCVLGLQIAFGDRWPLRKASLFVLALMMFFVATLLQVFRIDDIFKMLSGTGHGITYNNFLWKSYEASKNAPYAGGLVGGLLGYPMGRYLDIFGSALVLFFVIGGLLMLLVKLVIPGAGESMSGWFGSILDDFGEWRQDRAAEQAAKREAEAERRAQMQENEYDQALLVPVPKDLFEPDEEADEPPPRQKGAPVKGRPVSAPKAPKAPPVIAPRTQMQMEPLPMEPLYDIEMPTPKFAQKKEARQNPPEAMQPPPPEPPMLKKPRGRLYIEDILPEGAYSPMADAYTEEDVERFKQRTRSARKDPDAVPEFIAKRRAQYDEAYGAFESLSSQSPAITADEELIDMDMPEPEEEPPFAETLTPEPEADMVHVDDVPWETIDDQYTPEEEPARPVRRRRAHIENPLDYQPQLDPETRLDKPDWKPEPPPAVTAEVAEIDEYRQPPFSLLINAEGKGSVDTRVQDAENAQKLEETLASFGVDARVIKVVHGPAVTRYELQPAPGVKVSKIVNLTDDIALNMAAIGVRIEAPIPGKAAIGIEIANDDIATVHLREVLESEESIRNPSKLAVALGKDIAGKRIIADLARMPHLLIAGATGSGKSVCINTIITSIIYRATPEEVRLILIDPKKVELAMYNGIPHLLVPVVTDPKKASGALSWAVMEMDERYKVFADVGVRDISGYNAQRDEDTPLMPQIVVIIDELSDLMLVAPGEVEDYICRIAQLARACGIHLVIATQRPSVNVITGIIKANIPSRIAFAVSSQVDSRTILDTAGADKLLGKGDMLYAPSGGGKPMRVQGCFVSDKEVARVTEYVKDRHTTDYSQAVIDALSTTDDDADDAGDDMGDGKDDPLFAQAVEIAVESGQASISMLQRRLRIGYARAGRIVDDMSRRNIISQADGAKPREVLITREDMQVMFNTNSKH